MARCRVLNILFVDMAIVYVLARRAARVGNRGEALLRIGIVSTLAGRGRMRNSTNSFSCLHMLVSLCGCKGKQQ